MVKKNKFDLFFKTILGVQFSSFPTHTISVSTSDNYITQKITGDMSSSFHYGGEFQLAYNVSEKYVFNLSIGTSFSTQNFSGTIRTEDIYAIDYSSFTAKQEISMFNICLGYTYKF